MHYPCMQLYNSNSVGTRKGVSLCYCCFEQYVNFTIYRMTSMNSTQLSSFAILEFLVSEGME